jgi:UDP-N-acetylmuramoylalanine--D-glutamate ligase
MITPHLFKDKTVAVLGLGRSGKSTAKALLRAGARVFAWDDQEGARIQAQHEGLLLTAPSAIEWADVDHLILSPGIPHQYPAPHPLVAQAQIAGLRPLSDIEILCLSQPKARYISITGTNGKSTTTTLIGHILKESGMRAEVGGNLGIPVMDLNPLNKEGTYVLEVSSYQLETSPSLHSHVSILLNITPDHLERHGGMAGYIAAKKLIYKNATLDDTLVISVDDPHCLSIYEELRALNQMTLLPLSVHKVVSEGLYVKDGVLYEKSKPVLDLKPLDRLRGQHNWQNIAAAYGALRSLGLEGDIIAEHVASFPGLAHRQQVVARHRNVTFVNDSKATNAEAVAKAVACYQHASLYCLFGGRPKEGGITALKPYFPSFKHAFLYGEAASAFALTLKGAVPYTLCETLEEAVQRAASLAFQDQYPDAVVLLSPACASFDQFRDFEARGEAFCHYIEEIIEPQAQRAL